MTPGMILETWVLFEFLTLSACSALRFDPGVGAGKLPALRAVVDGRASLVTPGLYPAFSSSPAFSLFYRGCPPSQCLYIPPQVGHSGVLGFGGAEELPCVVEGPQTGSHGDSSCCAGFCGVLLQLAELALVV